MKYAILALLCLWAVLPARLAAEAQERAMSIARRNTANRIPVDYTRNGGETGYKHSRHCIDGRAF